MHARQPGSRATAGLHGGRIAEYEGTHDPNWHERDAHYSLLLDDVDENSIPQFLEMRGDDRDVDGNQNMRVDFHNSDLRRLQGQALNYLAGRTRGELSASEVADRLSEDPDAALPNMSGAGDTAFVQALASAKRPGDVFDALFVQELGHGPDATEALDRLTELQIRSYDSDGNIQPSPLSAPDPDTRVRSAQALVIGRPLGVSSARPPAPRPDRNPGHPAQGWQSPA